MISQFVACQKRPPLGKQSTTHASMHQANIKPNLYANQMRGKIFVFDFQSFNLDLPLKIWWCIAVRSVAQFSYSRFFYWTTNMTLPRKLHTIVYRRWFGCSCEVGGEELARWIDDFLEVSWEICRWRMRFWEVCEGFWWMQVVVIVVLRSISMIHIEFFSECCLSDQVFVSELEDS
jgi:hypothetical protein